ncbi:MAG: hypothetical protein B6241_03525 [Spirochaetaceae bacterium 4572_59]|nr:MAG: hypothetical protein B6241_03525 [Spirochaetaceae bacterium 4572_59]
MKNSKTITTGSLIKEMVDLWKLAEDPNPYYRTNQYSSYDRSSDLPAGKGWFNNNAGFGGEEIPGYEEILKDPGESGVGEYLVCDQRGPGAMVRTWSANHKGDIKIFLDNNESPLYDGPAEKFYLNPYHTFAEETGTDEDIFKETFYQLYSAYCPIPFEKNCKIIWTGNLKDVHFYHVQFRLYEKGAEVSTFKAGDLKEYIEEIKSVAKILKNPDKEWQYRSSDEAENFTVSIPAGSSKEALILKGSGAIEKLSLFLKAKEQDRALRQTIIHIICEEAPWGEVQSPVGDFFGAAPGINPYVSIPFSVLTNGEMISRFIMPYESELKIVFENLGDQDVEIDGSALVAGYEWKNESSMHFRAKWRITHDMIGSVSVNQDMPYLLTNGSGTYVGSSLYLLNSCNIPASWGSWWGEGDEKIFVDEDSYPSIFGTGSEDYFNYAWGIPDIFTFPYFAQPRNDGPANRGFVTNNRWHIIDPISFRFRLSFYMEFWPHEAAEGVAYARIGYHYGKPGMMDDHVVITRDDVRHQELPENWKPIASCGTKGSVFFSVDELVKDSSKTTIEKNNLWSDGKLLRWQPEAEGDQLKITVPCKKNGFYNMALCLAMDETSGNVTISHGGVQQKWLGTSDEVSLYTKDRVLSRMYNFPAANLTVGDYELTLSYTGGKGRTIGLDFLQLQDVEEMKETLLM